MNQENAFFNKKKENIVIVGQSHIYIYTHIYMGGVKVRDVIHMQNHVTVPRFPARFQSVVLFLPWADSLVCPRQSNRTQFVVTSLFCQIVCFSFFFLVSSTFSLTCCRPLVGRPASVRGVAPSLKIARWHCRTQTKQKPFTLTFGPPSFFSFVLLVVRKGVFKRILTAWNFTHLVLIPS